MALKVGLEREDEEEGFPHTAVEGDILLSRRDAPTF